jgi:hypothetical protein
VIVFIMSVQEAADDWPERSLRQREWMTAAEALDRIEEPGLRDLLRRSLRLEDPHLICPEPVAG